jgi:hypothetical protein
MQHAKISEYLKHVIPKVLFKWMLSFAFLTFHLASYGLGQGDLVGSTRIVFDSVDRDEASPPSSAAEIKLSGKDWLESISDLDFEVARFECRGDSTYALNNHPDFKSYTAILRLAAKKSPGSQNQFRLAVPMSADRVVPAASLQTVDELRFDVVYPGSSESLYLQSVLSRGLPETLIRTQLAASEAEAVAEKIFDDFRNGLSAVRKKIVGPRMVSDSQKIQLSKVQEAWEITITISDRFAVTPSPSQILVYVVSEDCCSELTIGVEGLDASDRSIRIPW